MSRAPDPENVALAQPVLAVECHECGAGRGERCINGSGGRVPWANLTYASHSSRRRDAGMIPTSEILRATGVDHRRRNR